jgi:hypothetical protein
MSNFNKSIKGETCFEDPTIEISMQEEITSKSNFFGSMP